VRPPTLEDIPAILEVVHASDIAVVGHPDFTADEVLEILQAPNHDPRYDSWVALDAGGRIVGWAYIDNPLGRPREIFDVYEHPDHGRPAQAVLLDHVLARIVERAAAAGVSSVVARGGAIAGEDDYVALLRAAGFAFVKRYARMRRELTGPLPAPTVPAGVVVRTVRPDDDAEMRAFHTVLDVSFRDTLDHEPSTYEAYRARLAALPRIDWDEWFVAELDDGAGTAGGGIVAILQSSAQSPDEDEGWVSNLGVRREFRGRGLGRLLLLTAFHAYAAKGRRAAGLGVDLTNPTGAYGLYESVGMHPVYEADIYERTFPVARA
jgi:ribosomal protein S18 acetylase RimI-like enzyme